jgi:hypothetical protein
MLDVHPELNVGDPGAQPLPARAAQALNQPPAPRKRTPRYAPAMPSAPDPVPGEVASIFSGGGVAGEARRGRDPDRLVQLVAALARR